MRRTAVILAVVLLGCPCWGGDRKKSDIDLRRTPAVDPGPSTAKLSEYLALTKDQEKRMKTVIAQYRDGTVQKQFAVQAAQLEYLALIDTAVTDTGKLDAKFKEISALQADIRFDEIRKLRDTEKILDPDQFIKYKKFVATVLFR